MVTIGWTKMQLAKSIFCSNFPTLKRAGCNKGWTGSGPKNSPLQIFNLSYSGFSGVLHHHLALHQIDHSDNILYALILTSSSDVELFNQVSVLAAIYNVLLISVASNSSIRFTLLSISLGNEHFPSAVTSKHGWRSLYSQLVSLN